jgi:hypothetical protein
VNQLPPGGRTEAATKLRYGCVLKYDDHSSGEPLNAREKELIRKAVEDLDNGNDRWWFVAARYEMLRKGKFEDEVREMGKVGLKRWWNVVKDEGKDVVMASPSPAKKRTVAATTTTTDDDADLDNDFDGWAGTKKKARKAVPVKEEEFDFVTF